MSRFGRSIVCNPENHSSYRAIPKFLFALAGGCLAVVLLCAPAARAQVSASISGRVADPAGATVSGAAVIAKNVETGETRSTVTDDAGRFWVPSLAVGEYEVQVTKQGFPEAGAQRDSSGRCPSGHSGYGVEARASYRPSESNCRRPGGERHFRRYLRTRWGTAGERPASQWQKL